MEFKGPVLERRLFLCLSMNEFVNVPVDFPPELEARIQKIMEDGDLTRDEVIQGLLKVFFQEVDHPSEDALALALVVKRAVKESGAGG
jgi:hypothetical protein